MQQLLSSGAPIPTIMPHIPSGELPNKVLFIQDLPLNTTEESVRFLFQPYAGFKEVRLVPGRSDICFVEFDNEFQSTIAKNALDNHKMEDKQIKIVYAKK
jgi:RNA recognition motif-containing protein